MPIRKKINPPNDFWMSIIDFPPKIEDFNSLQFPEIAYAWIKNPENQIELLVNRNLRDFVDVRSFVKKQFELGQAKLIKTDPEDDPQCSNCAYFVCFGEDPDNLGNSVSFRIDQNWDNFSFPQNYEQSTVENIRLIVVSFSGAIIGRLDFPQIILSKDWIGNPEACYGYLGGKIVNSETIQKAIKDYFLLAQDYWGIATIIDKRGFIWLWNTRNQSDFELRSTGLKLKEWFQAELENPFRQRPEPNWFR